MVYNNTHIYEGRTCRAEQVGIDRLEAKHTHIYMNHIYILSGEGTMPHLGQLAMNQLTEIES